MGMSMNMGGSKSRVAPAMNVTPLVDVVLVLLIIFMVVTPLLTKKFWLHVPKKDDDAQNEPPPDSKPVVLTYHADGSIKINDEVVPPAELPDRITRVLAARGDSVIVFDAAEDADYGEAVKVMDVARGAGAVTIAVATEPLAQ